MRITYTEEQAEALAAWFIKIAVKKGFLPPVGSVAVDARRNPENLVTKTS